MSLKCGIVGLPNVGKSTLFNALTKAGIAAENYPFCTIEPNVGIVEVPDARMAALADIVKPQRMQPAITEFVDIAGLVAGASKGEGLGNQFLANIRETDGIVNVVRCFEDDNVIHVAGKIDPIADIETIITELALADLATVEKAQQRNGKLAKSGDKEAAKLIVLLEQVAAHLDQGKPARMLKLDADQLALLKPLCLLTIKPAMYVANVAEGGFTNNPLLDASGRIRRQGRRAGGADLRRAGSGDRRIVRGRQAGIPGRCGLGRARPEPPDPHRLQAARAANLFHRRGEGSARLDHTQRRYRPAGGGRDPQRFRARVHPRRSDRLR